jgi:hypothetical protein
MMEASGNLQAAGQVLNLFLDPSIADCTPFSKVRQQAFSLLDSERFAQVSEYICGRTRLVGLPQFVGY